jgi:hypothetical protein
MEARLADEARLLSPHHHGDAIQRDLGATVREDGVTRLMEGGTAAIFIKTTSSICLIQLIPPR